MELVRVLYVKSDSGPSGAERAFNKIESKLGSLRGRKFYGLIFGTPPNFEYWASVGLFPDDKPKEWGFDTWTIPGGRYAQIKLKDWNNNLDKVPNLFKQLAESNDIDTSRPSIEFYRSMDELLLRVPIK